MQSKSRSHNPNTFALDGAWLLSFALHGGVVLAAAAIFMSHPKPKSTSVDVEVIEAPKLAPHAVQITKPIEKDKPKPTQRQVFGVSRKSLTSDQGEVSKAGNTVAKTPDDEKLKPSDADSLPIPSEEYLVTQMPTLKSEIRIPYPPDAKKKGIQGPVVMDLLIDSSGRVREVTLVSGPDPSLNEAALSAIKNFQFSPAQIQDKPVAVRIRYAYRFVLEHG